jgi:hypothetical protein
MNRSTKVDEVEYKYHELEYYEQDENISRNRIIAGGLFLAVAIGLKCSSDEDIPNFFKMKILGII